MWGHRPRLDDDGTDASDSDGESNAASEHKRVKSDTDGGFLVRFLALQSFPSRHARYWREIWKSGFFRFWSGHFWINFDS